MVPLSEIEPSIRAEIVSTIAAARVEGESDEDIRTLVLDVFAATESGPETLADVYRSETIHACFARQMESIFTPEGIKL